MKKILLLALFAVLVSSCAPHLCPTYSSAKHKYNKPVYSKR